MILKDEHGRKRILKDEKGWKRMKKDQKGSKRKLKDFKGYQRIAKCLDWLPNGLMDYQMACCVTKSYIFHQPRHSKPKQEKFYQNRQIYFPKRQSVKYIQNRQTDKYKYLFISI